MMSFFLFKQKTAYEMRIIDWSSDVCSSDLVGVDHQAVGSHRAEPAEVADTEGGAHLGRKTWAQADEEEEGDQELGDEQPAHVAEGAVGEPDDAAVDDAVAGDDEAGGDRRKGRVRVRDEIGRANV